jgi:hypothetical protein
MERRNLSIALRSAATALRLIAASSLFCDFLPFFFISDSRLVLTYIISGACQHINVEAAVGTRKLASVLSASSPSVLLCATLLQQHLGLKTIERPELSL